MDELLDEWMVGWMILGWLDGCMDRWMDEWLDDSPALSSSLAHPPVFGGESLKMKPTCEKDFSLKETWDGSVQKS